MVQSNSFACFNIISNFMVKVSIIDKVNHFDKDYKAINNYYNMPFIIRANIDYNSKFIVEHYTAYLNFTNFIKENLF